MTKNLILFTSLLCNRPKTGQLTYFFPFSMVVWICEQVQKTGS
ncbi:hypothetical protein AM1_5125 [Acaryochloris marina MBIC11017]|uniref:Uncharacterized protein n=1 Tax=Acaryochloris marina (strain MBIC 11017) TaxID=329726 RepID=B0C7B1_ACAM1|nr:hypothetical protein AM1_5125 [Acaryochloris marina MBIC11017]